jgi:NAD+ kinase
LIKKASFIEKCRLNAVKNQVIVSFDEEAVMTQTFKTIGIMGRHKNTETTATMQALITYLKTKPVELVISDAAAKPLPDCNVTFKNAKNLAESVDLIIVVGGDGSLLQAAHHAVEADTPIIGVNRGRLGFLTDILPKDLEARIDAVLAGDFIEDPRFLLEASFDGRRFNPALNDIVLHAGNSAHMIEFEVYVDGHFMCSERSDGMIVATPTGSTAYALSGGGPIVHPGLDAMVLVPMFSHTLSNRPIVMPSEAKLTFIIGEKVSSPPSLSCDGEICSAFHPGDEIHIQAGKRLKLLHPSDYNYFANVRDKLCWGRKLGRTDE